MGVFNSYEDIAELADDTLEFHKTNITAQLRILEFKEGEQYISYISSLGISGYGDTKEEADEMLQYALDSLFEQFMKMSHRMRERELIQLGWGKKVSHQYSKAYIGKKGALQGLADISDEELENVYEGIATV